MSTTPSNMIRAGELLRGVFGTHKRVMILGSVARRAVEKPDEKFAQLDIAEELKASGQKVEPNETSPVFRLLVQYDLLDRSYEDRQAQYGIVQGEAQVHFWRAAHLMVNATENIVEEQATR